MDFNVRIKCQSCAVRLSGLCSNVSERAASDLARSVHRRRIPAGQIVYGGPNKTNNYAIIVSGVVKLVHTHSDGREQIVGLQFPSDFVGRPYGGESSLIAEAATDLELCCFSERIFQTLAEQHPDLERAVLKRTLNDLDAAREWMFMLGRKTAEERVATLLLLFARRSSGPSEQAMSCEEGRVVFNVPLSRTDIASCLGLRLETVSRQISALKAEGVVSAGKSRAFEVISMNALKQRAEMASAG